MEETKETSKKREQILAETIKHIEKLYGKGSVMKLGDMSPVDTDAISTGSIAMDAALGIGGFPVGRIIEIYGNESAGKTTLALQTCSECQKKGGRVAYIDVENAIDPAYAMALGVNVDDMILSQPDSGEQALDIADMLIKSGAIDLIVVDSVAALVPQAELDGEMSDQQVGLQARLLSKAMRKLTGALNGNKCSIIFINQIREKVGVMFGNPETTTGGKALKFYSSVRVELRKGEAIKEGTSVIGNKVNVKIVKNKVAPPFRTAQLEMIYGEGFSRCGELIDMAVEKDIIQKSGSWFSYKGEKIGQGRDTVKKMLKENPNISSEIEALVRQSIGLPSVCKIEYDADTGEIK